MEKIILFSNDIDILSRWKSQLNNYETIEAASLDDLEKELQKYPDAIVFIDYDSVSHDFNKLLTSNKLPQKTAVFERNPAIVTGKMLLKHGVKAYANSMILANHMQHLLQTIQKGDIWTYPELTAALAKMTQNLSEDAKKLIASRLSEKEKDVLFLILEGLSNDAIAEKLGITTRTVKAHISSIFEKLHVNDRVGLILLLKQ